MSTEQLHEMASNDTPSNVEVPKDWRALVVWAVGRFGWGSWSRGCFGRRGLSKLASKVAVGK